MIFIRNVLVSIIFSYLTTKLTLYALMGNDVFASKFEKWGTFVVAILIFFMTIYFFLFI